MADSPMLCHLLDVANNFEAIGFLVFLAIAVVLFAFSTVRLVRLRRLRISKDVQFIHWLLLLWTLCTTST
jgi:hypothetical protein